MGDLPGASWVFPDLPMVPLLQQLQEMVAHHRAAILTAPPGSGKTTLVPLALCEAPWLAGQKIVMLEPRRLAARAVAGRMAALLGEEVGERVGYQVRFDRQITSKTTIEVVTEGILTRRLQNDSGLAGVGLVIFDEFHERSLHADLGLALCLDLLALRDDLRILVMSATLQTEPLSRLMNGAPVLIGGGRSHPVEIVYWGNAPRGSLSQAVTWGVKQAFREGAGDILAFLPGSGEIRAAQAALRGLLPPEVVLIPLYGDLSREEQERAMRPDPGGLRRVILATDIAESSLTMPGITTVVDGGYCRRPRFYPGTGLSRLETVRISQASAEQRAGRAGRLGPGRCCRLWSPAIQEGLTVATPPEIVEADLAPLLLELALWGVSRVESMSWLDVPPVGAVQQARALLQELAALDGEGRVTRQGRKMAELPIHPRLAHMILGAATPEEQGLACDLAAIVEERSPWLASSGRGSADITERLQLLTLLRNRGGGAVRAAFGDLAVCQRIDRAARQFRRLAGISQTTAGHGNAGLLLAAAFPDRIARQRPGSNTRYLLSGGRGAQLSEGDPLTAMEMLVVAELDAGQTEGRIYQAAAVREVDFRERFAPRIQQVEEVFWDQRQERVVARRVERFGVLELQSRPMTDPAAAAIRTALLEGVRRMGLAALNWTGEARSFQARVMLLRQWHPEGEWPDFSDAALLDSLEEWLAPHLDGINRREPLQRLDVAAMLRQGLTWSRLQRLEEGAPSHWLVPSGSRVRIVYPPGEPPVLAVRMQELFGLSDTPTVCWGRVAMVLHLLNPANRPVQVTRDLRGFWNRTWPEVRRELQGRYPRHHWPEDPWSARATARVKPRQ